MGINIATEKEYSMAIRDMFPQGEYWEKQFADPESDANLFCRAKTQIIIALRRRMKDLLAESDCETAVETIGEWERVLLDHVNVQLPLDERREIISTENATIINRMVIADIAQKHGLMLVDIIFPFKNSFFGFSEFGRSIFSRPAFFSVFYIVAQFHSDALINEAKSRVMELLKRASFGHTCFGSGQFLGRSYFIKDYANRVFSGMRTLDDFEQDVRNKLLSSNITYFQYKL